jgi:hypothetical protein
VPRTATFKKINGLHREAALTSGFAGVRCTRAGIDGVTSKPVGMPFGVKRLNITYTFVSKISVPSRIIKYVFYIELPLLPGDQWGNPSAKYWPHAVLREVWIELYQIYQHRRRLDSWARSDFALTQLFQLC